MRAFRRLASLTAIAGLLLVPAAGIASASTARPAAVSPSRVRLHGGITRVTTAPGIAAALLKNGIVPVPTSPATEGIRYKDGQVYARFSFPVTGGNVGLNPLAGDVRHAGGILFIDVDNGKTLKVSRFTIDLKHADLTGIVNGNPHARVPLFTLDLSHAKLTTGVRSVHATGIVLKLTKAAAGALDATFGTTLFSSGLELGTASTTLRF
jgi:hypothetical protein